MYFTEKDLVTCSLANWNFGNTYLQRWFRIPVQKSYENGNSYAHSFCFSIHVILVSTASADFHLGNMVGHRMW